MKDWDKELEALMEICIELLATLGSDSEWTVLETDKMKRLKDLTSIIEKAQKIVGSAAVEVADPAEDKKIIEHFLARSKT